MNRICSFWLIPLWLLFLPVIAGCNSRQQLTETAKETKSDEHAAQASRYPASWWTPAPKEGAPSWEILPQEAGPGEVILSAVRLYLRYPLSYQDVSELLAERGLFVDASCIWRWVQAYAPELNKRCRPHLKSTNKSYRIDETYSALSSVLLRRVKVPLALG